MRVKRTSLPHPVGPSQGGWERSREMGDAAIVQVTPSRVGVVRVERAGLFLESCRRQSPQDTAGVLWGDKGEGLMGGGLQGGPTDDREQSGSESQVWAAGNHELSLCALPVTGL